MSFAILRHNKVKSSTKGAAVSHNHRLGDDDKVNIDKSQQHLNELFFGEGAKARIDAKLPEKIRKDAVVSVEILLTSGPEFFDEIEKDRTELATNPKFLAWVKTSLEWAKKEFGGNLVDATLHMDESTPHIHLLTVPITKDGRLCAKEVMARTEMQRRQTGYAQAMKPFGLARGEPAAMTKRRHIGLKEDAGSGGRASQLAAKLLATQAELAKVQARFDNLHRLSMGDMGVISELERKAKKMATEISDLKAENKRLVEQATYRREANRSYQPTLTELKAIDSEMIDRTRERMALEASKTALEALEEAWPGARVASKEEVSVGTLKAVFGRHVVLHIGRGVHVRHLIPEGQEVPKIQQTEQVKKGFER